MLERYVGDMTDLSLEELRNFAGWMNSILGYSPTIIGGWAVYFHSPGLGSIDIDVVLPSWEIKDRVINKYLAANGYEVRRKAFGVWEIVKFLVPGEEGSETYLDVCTLQDKNIVHGSGVEVPWSIATEWQREVEIEDGRIYIPDPEPLLVLKAKAAWDRNFDVLSGDPDEFKKDKVKKDRYDIISLLKTCDLRFEVVEEIIGKYGFSECFSSALSEAMVDKDALGLHDLGPSERKEIEKKFEKMMMIVQGNE